LLQRVSPKICSRSSIERSCSIERLQIKIKFLLQLLQRVSSKIKVKFLLLMQVKIKIKIKLQVKIKIKIKFLLLMQVKIKIKIKLQVKIKIKIKLQLWQSGGDAPRKGLQFHLHQRAGVDLGTELQS
jgi:hypothetical protein